MSVFEKLRPQVDAVRRFLAPPSIIRFRFMPALLDHDTFSRLCRGRDLIAAEYRSRVLLTHAAREACLSEFHFHRLFRATFGETPHDFLTHLRLRQNERRDRREEWHKRRRDHCRAIEERLLRPRRLPDSRRPQDL